MGDQPTKIGALPDAARKAALAFTIVGFLFILFAAVLEILIMLKLWISQRLLQFAVLGLMTLALICFIIATAVSYMKSETRFGDWIMSAFWLNLGCLITALGYFFVELN
ncbi:hypothetical protein FGIG_06951 [Fasciola gigantica]|uniref:MARVEL domain-containing protein n=1 Tax=Fasciola gigantica TaxID=46835 RepID=A0A504YDX7_FASGI|nr:hypothetical protein FGIG_06951 [Fasciola gigantica]